MEPTRTTIKRIYALSQNRCAFPGCGLPIVENSGTVTGIVCHIRARKPGGPRFDKKQTEEQRHSFENLLLLCARHSKVIDSEPRLYSVSKLEEFKRAHEKPTENELSVADGKNVDRLVADYRDIYINATKVYIERVEAKKVEFHNAGRPNVVAPDDAIGSDLLRRNYTKYLIDRYNRFASSQPDREKFAFPAVYSLVESRYGVKKWELIPMRHFEELCDLLRTKIDKTWLASVNRSKGRKSFSTLDEYRVKYFERSARRSGRGK